MTIFFDTKDRLIIESWISAESKKIAGTADDFIAYLENEIIIDPEMASIYGEYEHWRDEVLPQG